MSGNGLEALPDIRGMVRRPSQMTVSSGSPSRMSGSGQEALPNDYEWWESLPDVQQWSGGPPKCL